jgi:hypothetical protein
MVNKSEKNTLEKVLDSRIGLIMSVIGIPAAIFVGAYWCCDHFIVCSLEQRIEDLKDQKDCKELAIDFGKLQGKFESLETRVKSLEAALDKCRENLPKKIIPGKLSLVVPSTISPGWKPLKQIQMRISNPPKKPKWETISQKLKLQYGSFGIRAQVNKTNVDIPAELIPDTFWIYLAQSANGKWVTKQIKLGDTEPIKTGKVYVIDKETQVKQLNEKGKIGPKSFGVIVPDTRVYLLEAKKLEHNQVFGKVYLVQKDGN